MLVAKSVYASELETYVTSEGQKYEATCNANGFKLTAKRSTVYLGADCDAFQKQQGTGKWCWANGGFVAEFKDMKLGFPRQELSCSTIGNLGTKCRC